MNICLRQSLSVIVFALLFCSVAKADTKGIRAIFFDMIDNPWTLAEQGKDESNSSRFISDGLLVIKDGLIVDFGPFEEISPKHPGLKITAYQNRLIMPGLIDAHIHFPQTRVIGAYGEHLLDWLQDTIYPEEARYFDRAYATYAAREFIHNILAAGTTTFQSFTTTRPVTTEVLFEEADRHNMRIITGVTGIDRNAPDYYKDTPESFYRNSKELIKKYHGKNRLLYAITPRFAFGSSREQMAMCQKLKEEHPDCWVNTHLAETIPETNGVHEYYNDCKDYLAVYEKYGLVGPKFSGGHSVWLSDDEFQRMHDAGACAVFCPCSNFWLGSGLFQIGNATRPDRPVLIAAGTDMGGGNTFSMLRVLNDCYKVGMLNNSVWNGVHSPSQKDPKRAARNKLSAYRAMYLATLGSARALRLDKWLGNFEKGKEADFIVLNLDSGPEEQDWLISRQNVNQPKPGTDPNAAFTKGKDFPNTHEHSADCLLALIAVGDSRCVEETWIMGDRVWPLKR